MYEYLPILIVGAIIGIFTLVFTIAWLAEKNRKEKAEFDRHMDDREIIRRLLVYAQPYRKAFGIVLVLLVFSIAYDLVSPLLIGQIEETVKGEFQLRYLWTMVGLYAGILVISMICTYGQSMILQKTGQKILSALREDIFVHIENLSHGQLSAIPVGKLVTRVTNDTNAISYMFTNILVTLIKNIVVVVGVLFAMLLLNYALTLMVLCFVPFVVLFTVIFRKFSRKVHRSVNDATTDVNTYLSENLSGMKITQIFNQEDRKMEEFLEKSENLRRAKKNRMFVFGIFRPMIYMLYISSVLCLFYLGGRGYIDDFSFFGQTMTSGVIVTFYMYISRFFNPIQTLAEQFDTLQRSFAAAEKIFTIMDMVPQITDETGVETGSGEGGEDALIDLETIRGEIEFRDVWFSYNPGEWVLKGISFHVEPGQTVALVGATGSGKSTILSLICRNYDIQKGQILIDGIDIKKIRIASLRRHFGQMLQDVFLFSGSIRSNLTLRDEFTEEEIWQACRYVNADSFISRLKNGLDEEVLERGNNFSAGQRQLLSFARTVLHHPSVMILDEATANIDTETELLIQDSLEKMRNIGTMLIVAHRLSTIQHADHIILLSHGEIMEEGNHQSLLKQKGRYYQLYTLQYHKEQLAKQCGDKDAPKDHG
ncbi:MAG: ABC transporter ATP-binding protein [Firmicutes bacterium]|nr:ABC transporter ATP-binding protein [Bacillota bacterium]